MLAPCTSSPAWSASPLGVPQEQSAATSEWVRRHASVAQPTLAGNDVGGFVSGMTQLIAEQQRGGAQPRPRRQARRQLVVSMPAAPAAARRRLWLALVVTVKNEADSPILPAILWCALGIGDIDHHAHHY